jgi:hypothetical protein
MIKEFLFDNKYKRHRFMLCQLHKYVMRKRNFKRLTKLYKDKYTKTISKRT